MGDLQQTAASSGELEQSEHAPARPSTTQVPESSDSAPPAAESSEADEELEVIDISPTGCPLASLNPGSSSRSSKQMYVFDNVFTVVPRKILRFSNLKLLKLFSNEVKYFPSELQDLPDLHHLHVRTAPLGLDSFFPLARLTSLKALELHQLPLRPSAASIPADITQLRGLTRLVICHFSICFLPPEIGSLHNLQELDLSFNKLKFLPEEVSRLVALKSLKLSNNKLVELPSGLSKLLTLVTLDVGYNRLTTLLTLDLRSMTSLRELNAQFNRLQTTGEIPEWLVCKFDGNELPRNGEKKKVAFPDKVADLKSHPKPVTGQDRLRKHRKHKLELEEAAAKDNSEEMLGLQPESESAVTSADPEANEMGREVRPDNTALQIQVKEVVVVSETVERYKRRDAVAGETNPKPSKRPKSTENHSEVSFKYSKDSFCGFGDYLSDGFYDAGRNHPFVAIDVLEKEQCSFECREVILVDRSKDEDLDVMASSARQLFTNSVRTGTLPESDPGELWKVVMLALFVSDCLGGSDKTLNIKNMRRAALGSTSNAPFVCSCCSTTGADSAPSFSSSLPSMRALSDEAVRYVKLKRGSNVVPLGSLPYGICRHRAILLKYLCDRAQPVISCELIRGYLDYMPHAWNVVLVPQNGVNVRMLVDACRPLDVRLESDPEYFCRYIPMRRLHLHPKQVELGNEAFVPIFYESIGRGASGADVRKCTLGGCPAAAKVRHLDGGLVDTRQEQSDAGWLSELRIHCSVGEHPNVVSFYGHQLSLIDSLALKNGTKQLEAPQLVIFMEYIKGGSLDNVIRRFSEEGCLFMPPHLATCIARSVAEGLVWLHSRGIIHRDIKSSNILVELDSDNGPVVKICDFDSAVPLGSSSVHTCYLAHYGLPLTDVCVGTPRWIAPEVLDAMYSRQQYGLEADIWSFGCLISELLTLQVPYVGVHDSEIHTYIKAGQRPALTWTPNEIKDELTTGSAIDSKESLQLLIDLYESCTQLEPAKRPTAKDAVSKLSALRKRENSAS